MQINNTFLKRLKKSVGFRLSSLGERLGIQGLLYNRWIMREFHEHGLREAPKVYRAILEVLPDIRRVFDVGSGSGVFAAEGVRRGLDVIAAERSIHGQRMAANQGVSCAPFDLMESPPSQVSGPFDLVYNFEVAEHLPPALGDALVKFIASFNATVLFTAAHPGQGGIGHINEQPAEYWIDRFARHSFVLDQERTAMIREAFKKHGAAFWFIENALIFKPAR